MCARLASAIATPGSAEHGEYLSVGGFAARFGAATSAVKRVRAALAADGLRVGATTANGLSIDASGTVATVENALDTRIVVVRLPQGGTVYAAAATPLLPAAIAGDVEDIAGLDDVDAVLGSRAAVLHRGARRAPPPGTRASVDAAPDAGPQPCAAAKALTVVWQQHAYDNALTANTVASAYDFTGLYARGDEGAGVTVAVLGIDRYRPADVAEYQSCYGTDTTVDTVPVDGGNARDPFTTEAVLDLEQIIGLAPRATVLDYEATSIPALYEAAVSADAAKVMTNSYTPCETNDRRAAKAVNTALEEAAAQGQSAFAASGDLGSAGCDQGAKPSSALAVKLTADAPFVTGVGGTSLYTGTSADPRPYDAGDASEQGVWNDGLQDGIPDATGGGLSAVFRMPAYQSRAASSLGVIGPDSGGGSCGARYCREVPDVSADADPLSGYAVYTTTKGTAAWQNVGGTSAAAPVWAALAVLTDALPRCDGDPVGFLNPELYKLAASSRHAALLTDIDTASPESGRANNDAVGTNGGRYPVGTGYDMATGLGTPIGTPLATALCAAIHPAPVSGKTVPPSLHTGSLTGLAAGAPRLAFTLAAGSSRTTTVAITPPRGLSWAQARLDLTKYLKVKAAAHATPSLLGHALVLSFAAPVASARVIASHPLLLVGRGLMGDVKRGRTKTVTFTIAGAAKSGAHTTLALTLHVRR